MRFDLDELLLLAEAPEVGGHAAISHAAVGGALGVDNNAGGMRSLKVAHAVPLHIGGGGFGGGGFGGGGRAEPMTGSGPMGGGPPAGGGGLGGGAMAGVAGLGGYGVI